MTAATGGTTATMTTGMTTAATGMAKAIMATAAAVNIGVATIVIRLSRSHYRRRLAYLVVDTPDMAPLLASFALAGRLSPPLFGGGAVL